MKKLIVLTCSVLLLGIVSPCWTFSQQEIKSGESIHILCSPDLYQLAKEFVDAYQTENPDLNLTLNSLKEKQTKEWIGKPGHIAILSKGYMDGIDPLTAKLNVIGRDVYVPIINPENPHLEELRVKGISPREFALLYTDKDGMSWGELLNTDSKVLINSFRTQDAEFEAYLSRFIGVEPASIYGNSLENSNQVMQAVLADKNAIAFCKLNQFGNSNNNLVDQLVPVDLNDNNKIDHFEDIYGSLEALNRGVWIGKYDQSLYSRIYVVSSELSNKLPELEFVRWIAGKGQYILAANGFTTLLEGEQKDILANLDGVTQVASNTDSPKQSSTGLLLILVLLATGSLVYITVKIFRTKSNVADTEELNIKKQISDLTQTPQGYFFDRSHTWTYLEKDGMIRIGVDGFLQKVTGTITKVEMKSAGERIKKGETIFSLIQNGKKLNIKSPLSGIIKGRNEVLSKTSSLINSSPYSEGWVYLVESSSWIEELNAFFIGERYNDWIKDEYKRLKDFLSTIVNPGKVCLQEGGEVCDDVLSLLGPDVWEEFQTEFLKN